MPPSHPEQTPPPVAIGLTGWFGTPTPASARGLDGAFGDYVALYAWFLGLQVMDLMGTLAVLGSGGHEGNAIAAWAFASWGPAALLATKLVAIVVSALVWVPAAAWLDRTTVPGWARTWVNSLVAAAVVFYSAIVFYNMATLAILLAA